MTSTLTQRARIQFAFARHDLDRKVGEPLRWWLVNRLPRCVVTWALLRAGVECTGHSGRPDEEVPAVPFTTVLQRWSEGADRR